MKIRLWMSCAALAAMMFAGTACNDDWGQQDPPAGNQVYPTLQNVAKITFEDEGGNPVIPSGCEVFAGANGVLPEVVIDEVMNLPVLDTKGGYISLENPLKSVKLQKGASYTFWVRQPMDVDADGNPVNGAQNLKGSIFSVVNDGTAVEARDGQESAPTGTLTLSADGTLSISTSKGTYTDTDVAFSDSVYMAPNEWHYVALAVKDDGYIIAVNGVEAVNKSVPELKDLDIVSFLNKANKINFGSTNSDEVRVAELTTYRNVMTQKEIKRPNKGTLAGGGDDEGGNLWVFGPEDNIQGWWSIWTPSVNLQGDGTIHYEFTNYTIGNNNWENWVLVLTNSGLSPNDNGYDGSQEIIVLRADAWGWAAKWGESTVEHDYNWDTFTSDMKEAFVTVDIVRKGTDVVMTAITKTKAGQTYTYKVSIPGVDCQTLGSFFTLENAHMVFNADETFAGQVYPSGSYILGNKDFSNGFWSCWTDQVKMESPFENFGFEFVNHSAKGGNWQYWNLVVTNGYQSAPDGQRDPEYYEWYYLRCDAFGWGGLYGDGVMTHNFDWSTFIEDMDGAKSRIFFTYDNMNGLTMVARQNRADGSEIPEYRFVVAGVQLPVGLIFTCESSWLDFSRVGYFPWVNLEAK